MFRALGKHPNSHLESLKRALDTAGTELWVPATVYHELSDPRTGDSPVNPYLDTAIEEGWIRVATPLPGGQDNPVESATTPNETARHLADEFLAQESKYPDTNNWHDASIVALAVRLFEQNARIRVITHTADENLAHACTVIPPEFGYYEIQSRYYNPPQTAKDEFPTVEHLTWDGQ